MSVLCAQCGVDWPNGTELPLPSVCTCDLKKVITTLESENARLREALQGLVDAIEPPMPKRRGHKPKELPLEQFYIEPMRKAKSALKATSEGQALGPEEKK